MDLAAERRNGDFVRAAILAGDVLACHDCSDGGLLVAVAEMCLAAGLGAELLAEGDHGFWFGEDQGRYVVAARDGRALLSAAEAAGIPALALGRAGGRDLVVPGAGAMSVAQLAVAHEATLPRLMGED